MHLSLTQTLLDKYIPDHLSTINAASFYLSTPHMTKHGHLTPMENGTLDLTKLEAVLSHQIGSPLYPDLSNLDSDIMPLLDTVYKHSLVSSEEALNAIDKYIDHYIKSALPRFLPLSKHQRILVDSLIEHFVSHPELSAAHLATQSHFYQLARNAFLDSIMQKHYYQRTGALALISRLSDEHQELIVSTCKDENILGSAIASLRSTTTFIGSVALLSHYKAEAHYGAPLADIEYTAIFSRIKGTLNL